MTNRELAAAAERLLTEQNYNYWECNWPTNAMTDSALLAKHYLAQHDAEDDLPVSEEWLRSIGFDETLRMELQGRWELLAYIHDEWCLYIENSPNDYYGLSEPKTRRAVKQLLQALGITTKGTAHE